MAEPEYDKELADLMFRPYKEPRTIECKHCGKEVVLQSSWANECEGCGTEYNGSGQMLAPRSQWGEETGEIF